MPPKKRGRPDNDDDEHGLLHTAILVRTHAPTPSMIDRILTWAASAERSRTACFCASVDVTSAQGRAAAAVLRSHLNSGHAIVHEYDADALVRAYPVLRHECQQRVEAASQRQWRSWGAHDRDGHDKAPPPSLAWGFHLEAINLFVQAQSRRFDFYWVVEDDVGFTGDLCADLCAAYTSDRADLVTSKISRVFQAGRHGRPTRVGPAVKRWIWSHAGSDAFLSRIAPADRVKSPEHCQRFSRRLLDECHRLARDERVSAWSEMATPTLCGLSGFEFAHLRTEHVGEPFAFHGRVSRQAWNGLESADRAAHGKCSRLYHALKW